MISKWYFKKDIFFGGKIPFGVIYSNQPEEIAPHRHDYLELALVSQGGAVHRIGTTEDQQEVYTLLQGDLFSVMPEEFHSYYAAEKFSIFNIALDFDFLAPVMDELRRMPSFEILLDRQAKSSRGKVHLPRFDRNRAVDILKSIISECALRQSGFELKVRLMMWEFLLDAVRADPHRWNPGTNDCSGISRVLSRMESSPEKHYPLEDMAKTAAMSVSLFSMKFREATGLTPGNYLLNLRLEKARIMLEKDSVPISGVAVDCGFCDSSYFTKLFRRRYGVTPRHHRDDIFRR